MKKVSHYRVRYCGIAQFSILSGQTNSGLWKIPQLTYQGQNVPSVFDGVQYTADNRNSGDKVSFQITDEDNILGYGAGFVVEEFGTGLYVMPPGPDVQCYLASLVTDFYVKIIYENAGPNNVDFSCNLLRHINTEDVI